MSHKEQQTQFENELIAVIERFKAEYDLTCADAIGVIETVKLSLHRQQHDAEDEE
jgi:hypothetical protein